MKKFLVAALLAAVSVWAAGDLVNGGSLIGEGTTWLPYQGNDGNANVTSSNPLVAELTIPEPNTTNAWAEVAPGFTADFRNLTSITIKGETNKTIRLTLAGTADTEDWTYSNFVVELDGTFDKTVTLDEFDYAFGTGPALDLSKVTGISIASSAETGEYNFTITALIINATEGNNNNNDNQNPPPSEEFIELVGYADITWIVNMDGFDTGTAFDTTITSEMIKATLTVGESDGGKNVWPFIGLGTYPGISFANITHVEITYKADKAFGVALSHKHNTTGVAGAHDIEYVAPVPAAATPTPITIQLSDFKIPDWPPEWFTGTAANLSLANKNDIAAGFAFTHSLYGETVNIEVTSIKLYGLKWDDDGDDGSSIATRRISRANALSITGFSAGRLNLNVATAGAYTVSIYGADGRVLAQTKTNLTRGVNSLAIGKNLARGVVLVRVQGANVNHVRKMSIR